MRVSNILLVFHYYLVSQNLVHAQSSSSTSTASPCTNTITPQSNATPSVAPGWQAAVVANNLTSPRGIKFDTEGALLVVEQERGIVRLTINGEGGCARNNGSPQLVIDDPSVSLDLDIHTQYHRPSY